MSYEQVDSVIAAWGERNGLTLFTGVEGDAHSDVRAVYLSSAVGECCQIWIDAPEAGMVSIHAADVESRFDEEMHQDWCVPVAELGSALDLAIAHVHKWFQR